MFKGFTEEDFNLLAENEEINERYFKPGKGNGYTSGEYKSKVSENFDKISKKIDTLQKDILPKISNQVPLKLYSQFSMKKAGMSKPSRIRAEIWLLFSEQKHAMISPQLRVWMTKEGVFVGFYPGWASKKDVLNIWNKSKHLVNFSLLEEDFGLNILTKDSSRSVYNFEKVDFNDDLDIPGFKGLFFAKTFSKESKILKSSEFPDEVVSVFKKVYPVYEAAVEIVKDGVKKNRNYEDLKSLLLSKKQIVFYGPPGTGKTYKARRFALEFIESGS